MEKKAQLSGEKDTVSGLKNIDKCTNSTDNQCLKIYLQNPSIMLFYSKIKTKNKKYLKKSQKF